MTIYKDSFGKVGCIEIRGIHPQQTYTGTGHTQTPMHRYTQLDHRNPDSLLVKNTPQHWAFFSSSHSFPSCLSLLNPRQYCQQPHEHRGVCMHARARVRDCVLLHPCNECFPQLRLQKFYIVSAAALSESQFLPTAFCFGAHRQSGCLRPLCMIINEI